MAERAQNPDAALAGGYDAENLARAMRELPEALSVQMREAMREALKDKSWSQEPHEPGWGGGQTGPIMTGGAEDREQLRINYGRTQETWEDKAKRGLGFGSSWDHAQEELNERRARRAYEKSVTLEEVEPPFDPNTPGPKQQPYTLGESQAMGRGRMENLPAYKWKQKDIDFDKPPIDFGPQAEVKELPTHKDPDDKPLPKMEPSGETLPKMEPSGETLPKMESLDENLPKTKPAGETLPAQGEGDEVIKKASKMWNDVGNILSEMKFLDQSGEEKTGMGRSKADLVDALTEAMLNALRQNDLEKQHQSDTPGRPDGKNDDPGVIKAWTHDPSSYGDKEK